MSLLIRLSMIMALAAGGCAYDMPAIEARPLEKPNPTSYIYPVPIASVREQIDALCLQKKDSAIPAFETQTSQAVSTCSRAAEGADRYGVPLGYTANYRPELQRDEVKVYLRLSHWSVFSKEYYSRTYYSKNGGPRSVTMRLGLMVQALDENRTFIQVQVLEQRAYAGYYTSLHMTQQEKWIKLPPTTIEEYEIILDIGKRLNVQGMPMLQLPSSD